jgi:triosephosphate isomerase
VEKIMNTAVPGVYRNYFRQRKGKQWQKVEAKVGEPGAIRPFLAGNWKMHTTPRSGIALVSRILDECRGMTDVDVGFAPPFLGLAAVRDYLEADFLRSEYGIAGNVHLYAQDAFYLPQGAYTGEVSAAMLKAAGVEGVILGHSDRRTRLGNNLGFATNVARRLSRGFLEQKWQRIRNQESVDPRVRKALEFLVAESNDEFRSGLAQFLEEEIRGRAGESDGVIQKKVCSVLEQGMRVLLCVGEDREARDHQETFRLLDHQLRMALDGLPAATVREIVIAYEPVWAIGPGAQPAQPEQIAEAHDFIRDWIAERHGEETAAAMRILYGGNVSPNNVVEIMRIAGVDGALVGGASVRPHDFAAILHFGLANVAR